jgi:23S rRNA (cytosine1962-C5)-methyltransferase
VTQYFFPSPPVNLILAKNLSRSIKRGHPWVYSLAVQDLPEAPPGSFAVLKNKKGEKLASGYYDPDSPIVFRVCSLHDFDPNSSKYVEQSLVRCNYLRKSCVNSDTTGYRFINGEGDGIPGVVCDVYDDTAVLTFDGRGAECFWNKQAFSEWLIDNLRVNNVVVKARRSDDAPLSAFAQDGPVLLSGTIPEEVVILENGVKFSVNISKGQKTGFFLDQRNNRQTIRQVSKNRRVLNLFGYTGGFSVYAGLGGASCVTTVDLSKPAIEASNFNWKLNGLDAANHRGVVADVFDFIESDKENNKYWDLIIIDPPSFASSKENVPKASRAYGKLISGACKLLNPGGLLAASSCSSHIDHDLFLAICENAVSRAHKRARVILIGGQPADHPFPLASREFRYLKFVLLEVYE